MNNEMERQLQKFSRLPPEVRQRNNDPRYQATVPSRTAEHPRYSQVPPHMGPSGQNPHYARNGYDQSSRERHHKSSKSHYLPQEFVNEMRKYGGMNGNPNQISNSLNRENSSSYNHHSHRMSAVIHSPALDLASSHGHDPREKKHERMHNFGREREQSVIHRNYHH